VVESKHSRLNVDAVFAVISGLSGAVTFLAHAASLVEQTSVLGRFTDLAFFSVSWHDVFCSILR